MRWQRFKEQLKEFITFTRKERNGILILFLLLALSQAAVVYTHYMEVPRQADFSGFEKQLAAFRKLRDSVEVTREPGRETDNVAAPYRDFDPNTADAAVLASFNLPEKTINAILKFRSKGGKFRKKEDLKKIYNMQAADYERLKPYIRIKDDRTEYTYDDKLKDRPAALSVKVVELNAASKEDLMTLPMIGEKRAEQIIKYRKRLGGFFRKEQLREVYTIPDSIYTGIESRIEVNPLLIQPIDLNVMSDSTYHPYLKKNLVKLIVAYRNQHGKYRDKEGIRKMPLMSDSVYIKIEPYLSVDEMTD